MDLKKLILAIVVGYVVLVGLAYVIHGVWLQPVYEQYAPVWRLREAMLQKRWIMWVGQLIFTVMFAWIYTRGVENKPWIGQGLRYGVAMTLLAVVPAALSEYVVYPIPYTLALEWIVGGAVQVIVLALIVAGFCQKPAR